MSYEQSDSGGVTIGEVYRLCQRIEGKVDKTNGQVADHANRISVLEDRNLQATKDSTARYSGIGAIVASAGALVWQWLKG